MYTIYLDIRNTYCMFFVVLRARRNAVRVASYSAPSFFFFLSATSSSERSDNNISADTLPDSPSTRIIIYLDLLRMKTRLHSVYWLCLIFGTLIDTIESYPYATLISFIAQVPHQKRQSPISSKLLQHHVASEDNAPRPGSMEAARLETGKVPYGENSREYRRTIFRGSNDWIKHRDPDRVFHNLQAVFLSGVARQLARPVAFMSFVALAVVSWNAFLPNFQLRLPLQPFSFSVPALGLLLVFRTNSSYQRWLDAQNNISRINAQLKNILRMTSTWIPTRGEESLGQIQDVGLSCWAVLRSIQNNLRGSELDDQSYENHIQKTLRPDIAEKLLKSKDKTFWAIQDLSAAIQKLPIDEAGKKREMDKSIVIILSCTESCLQIFRYPVPLVYSRHTARFLATFLISLPLAFYDLFSSNNKLMLVPVTYVVSFFFLGIDELAVQLEEPFSILPLEYSCAELKRRSKEAMKWHATAQQDKNK